MSAGRGGIPKLMREQEEERKKENRIKLGNEEIDEKGTNKGREA